MLSVATCKSGISADTRIESCFHLLRSFEAFKYLHVGMISEVKRKTLPEIARVVGLSNEQGLLHFLTESPWEIEKLREARTNEAQ